MKSRPIGHELFTLIFSNEKVIIALASVFLVGIGIGMFLFQAVDKGDAPLEIISDSPRKNPLAAVFFAENHNFNINTHLLLVAAALAFVAYRERNSLNKKN
ncbi:hypothetical protein L0Y46_04735 [bacterium]|nr:hypothetical protein [bacterium]MCI0680176.1 hypothetical protein [bacterium]